MDRFAFIITGAAIFTIGFAAGYSAALSWAGKEIRRRVAELDENWQERLREKIGS